MEWNGRSLQGKSYQEVYDIIAESKQEPQVELIVTRLLPNRRGRVRYPTSPTSSQKGYRHFSISFFIHFAFHLFANNFHSFDINTIFEINIQSFVNSLTNTRYVVWNLHNIVIFFLDSLFIIPPSTLEHTSQPLLLCYHYMLGYLQSTKRITI